MKTCLKHIIKGLLGLVLAVVLLLLLLNMFLKVALIRALSGSHFEYVQYSYYAQNIRIDYQKLPEELKAKLSRVVKKAAWSSFAGFNSYVLGVIVKKEGVSINVHPNFIVFNFDSLNFTWQLESGNTKEGKKIALELRQWIMEQTQSIQEPSIDVYSENEQDGIWLEMKLIERVI